MNNTEKLIQFNQRQFELDSQIRMLKSTRFFKDLDKMRSVIEHRYADISRELVECRRLRRETVKFSKLIDQYEQSIVNCERYLTIALLSK